MKKWILLLMLLPIVMVTCNGKKRDKITLEYIDFDDAITMEAYCEANDGIYNDIFDWKPVPGSRNTLYTREYAVSNMPRTGQRCDCLVTITSPPECLMMTDKLPEEGYVLQTPIENGVFVGVVRE